MWRTPGRTRAVHGVIIQQTGSLMPINPALSHVLVRIRRRPIGATVTCVVLVGGTLVSSTHVSAAEPTTNQTSTGLRSPPAQGGESASRPSNVSVTFTDGKRVVLSPSTGPTPISEGRQGSRILVAGDEGSSEPSRCEQSGVETARGEGTRSRSSTSIGLASPRRQRLLDFSDSTTTCGQSVCRTARVSSRSCCPRVATSSAASSPRPLKGP